MQNEIKPNEIKRIVVLPYKAILFGLSAVVGIYLLVLSFNYLSSIYITILVSYFFAFLLNPVVGILDKRGLGRTGTSVILLSIFFIFILLIAILLAPRFLTQMKELLDHMPEILNQVVLYLTPYSIQYLGYDIFSDWQRFAHDIIPKIAEIPAKDIVGNFFSGTMKALSVVTSLLIVPILTFYILKEYPYLNSQVLNFVPRRYVPAVTEVSRRLSMVLGGLIRGQLVVCAILSTYYSIALSALGLKLSMVLGIISGLLNLIPFIGTLVAMTTSVLICVFGGGGLTQSIGVVGVFLVANLIDNTLLTPRIIGKQMGISPLTIILVMLSGGELLGFLGIMLALPVTAMVKVLVGFLLEKYFSSNYYKDQIQKE